MKLFGGFFKWFFCVGGTVARRNPAPLEMNKTWKSGVNYISTGAGFLPSTVCPMPYMHGIFTFVWLILFMVNVGKYTIHGDHGCGSFIFNPLC